MKKWMGRWVITVFNRVFVIFDIKYEPFGDSPGLVNMLGIEEDVFPEEVDKAMEEVKK